VHPDTGSDMLDNIDGRQVRLVILCQRNGTLSMTGWHGSMVSSTQRMSLSRCISFTFI